LYTWKAFYWPLFKIIFLGPVGFKSFMNLMNFYYSQHFFYQLTLYFSFYFQLSNLLQELDEVICFLIYIVFP